jgi:hypothetical protein
MDFQEIKNTVISKIKGIYFYFEDKWYSTLDKLDQHVPIYKVIDPIDKIIPSYILFLLLILFSLILTGYFISFSNTYDIKIITLDSKTNLGISNVNVYGSINEANFDEYSDSHGVLEFPVMGPKMNFFNVFINLFFPTDVEFEFLVSAKKDGYITLTKENFILTNEMLENQLFLSPISEQVDSKKINIRLVDSVSKNPIKDSTAYIKFKCDNDPAFQIKTINDSDDGFLDGKFVLNADGCVFRINEIGANNYETISNSFLVSQDREISLIRLNNTNKGSVKLHAVELNSSPKKNISGISIKLNKEQNDSLTTIKQGITDNSGVLTLTDLSPGEYLITTISLDENSPYIPITPSDNITINVIARNTPTEETIYLTKLNPNALRKIFVKIIDSNSSPIPNSKISIYWLRNSQNKLIADSQAGASPKSTDLNGLVTMTGFTANNAGQLIGVVYKQGYLHNIFDPQLFDLNSGPQTITLTKANETNSGKAQINVLDNATANSQYPKKLRGANTTLYLKLPNMLLANQPKTIERLIIGQDITNNLGESKFNNLIPGTYSASANYKESDSGISTNKILDVNQLIIFDLNIDTNISFLRINLFNKKTNEQITNSNAKIKIYTLTNPSNLIKTLSETISITNNQFESLTYDSEIRLEMIASAPGFVSTTIQNITDLATGPNDFNIYLYPVEDLDKNVNIFFDTIYTNLSDIEHGSKPNSFVWNANQDYFAKFDVIIHKDDFNYTDLFSFVRINEFGNIKDIPIIWPRYFYNASDILTQTTINADLEEESIIAKFPPHIDNYYFPTNISTFKNQEDEGVQAIIKWNGFEQESLNPMVYTFIVKFKLNEFEDDDVLEFNYRAKEKHNNNSSETNLESTTFKLGDAICEEVCFTININGKNVLINGNNYANLVGETQQLQLNENTFSIRAYNGTDSTTTGTLKVYSHQGTISSFNRTGSGSLKFVSEDGENDLVLAETLSINSRTNSQAYQNKIYPSQLMVSNYFVVEYFVNNTPYRVFVDTRVPGKELKLQRKNNFIAGLQDQDYYNFVIPKYGDEIVNLIEDTIKISVYKNCDEEKNPIFVGTNVLSASIDSTIGNNYFFTQIPGIYNINSDCIVVEGEALGYQPLNETIYASIGGSLDLGLTCLDISSPKGDKDITLNWNDTTNVKIFNGCNESASVYIETGLVCNNCNESNKIILDAGDSTEFEITGINKTYSSEKRFSDILGFFPVYLKAKKTSASRYKEYTVADKLNIHLVNPNECFAISKDLFDFIEDSSPKDFNITNNCQYVEFENYYIPKATLNSFGAEIKSPYEIDIDSIDFEWKLSEIAGTYETTYVSSESEKFLWPTSKNLIEYPSTPVEGKDYNLYENLEFDLSYVDGLLTKFQINWTDRIDPSKRDTNVFGIAIVGDITINFEDGTNTTITPEYNFSLTPAVTCLCDGNRSLDTAGNPAPCYKSINLDGVLISNECEIGQQNEVGRQDYFNPNNPYYYGLVYVNIPRENHKKPVSVTFNAYGPANPDELTNITIIPKAKITTTSPIINMTDDSEIIEFNLGSFTIYPIEGVTYILRNISYGQTALGTSLHEKYCIAKKLGQAWYSNNDAKIYWFENGIINLESNEQICTQTNNSLNILETPSTLINYNQAPNEIKQQMQLYLETKNIAGAWGTPNQLLTKDGITSMDDPTDFTNYIGGCEYLVPQNIIINDDSCEDGTINVICENDLTTNELSCKIDDILSSNIFFSINYLGPRNPSVNLEIEQNSIKANKQDNTSSLSDGAVIIWAEGKYLKARFIGDEINEYNNEQLKYIIENTFINQTQYGIINVIDYVDGRN